MVTAAVLIGPGATRKAAFVRVYGSPVAGSSALSLRIEGAERLFGIDENAALENLEVEVRDGATTLGPVRFSLGPDGVSEVWLEATKPLIGPLHLRVTKGQTVLAEGRVNLAAPTIDRTLLTPLNLPGHTTGNVAISVSVRRGVLAAPFSETLDIRVGLAPHVSPTNQGFGGIELKASAPGANVSPEKFVTDEHGAATIQVTPFAHHIELSIEAKSDAHGEGHWDSVLPVVPGAIWLDPNTKNGFDFVSPTSRDRVYLSFTGEQGRTNGLVLPVARDEQGFYRGHVDVGPQLRGSATQVMVSGDPQEQGPATVAWPIDQGREIVAAPRIQRLFDGGTAAEARERQRATRVRRLALLVVIAATIFEVLYIITKSRSSQRKLEESLERMADEGPEAERAQITRAARQDSPVLRVTLAVALVLLAFAMIGAMSTLTR